MRVPGTAVYMSRALNVIPFALLHNLKHNKVLHERVVIGDEVLDTSGRAQLDRMRTALTA